MQFCPRLHPKSVLRGIWFCSLSILSLAQNPPAAPKPKHFDHVLVVVLENQSYESSLQDDLLKSLASKGVSFTRFGNLFHHSYPNYLAMIAGSGFNTHKRINTDGQVDLPADNDHRSIANLLNWKNYAEGYPASPTDQKPFLDDDKRKTKYARKHVPFLSFQEVQAKSFRNVVRIDPNDVAEAFGLDFLKA